MSHLNIQASPEEVLVLMEASMLFYARCEYEKAEKVLRGALVMSPGNSDIYACLGALYHAQDRLDEAYECYEQALKGCPSEECARSNRATLLMQRGKAEDAIQELKRVIQEHDPSNPVVERSKELLKVAESLVTRKTGAAG
ncbi:MAG: tetratricopeptide repeat protein [Acidobacteriota bacterium]